MLGESANSNSEKCELQIARVDGALKVEDLRGFPSLGARWRSGDAADCKSVHPGSIPGRASTSCLPNRQSNVDGTRSSATGAVSSAS